MKLDAIESDTTWNTVPTYIHSLLPRSWYRTARYIVVACLRCARFRDRCLWRCCAVSSWPLRPRTVRANHRTEL